MWFRLPEGCGGITVERQEFAPEFRDDVGNAYFRAPDHFASQILAVKGFALVTDLPAGAPEDLPKADPRRDSTIAELVGLVEAQKAEVQNLRSDLTAAAAEVLALKNQVAALQKSEATHVSRISELEEQLEDATDVSASAGKKGK